MAVVIELMAEALNRHDIEAFVECFDPSYRSAQPAHPNRGFGGKEQVRKNWSGMFESFPDFEAQLLRHTSDERVVWGEWHWRATGLDMAGVTSWVWRTSASSGRGCTRNRSRRFSLSSADRAPRDLARLSRGVPHAFRSKMHARAPEKGESGHVGECTPPVGAAS